MELKADKLRAIVSDYLFWNAKATYDVLPYEFLDLTVMDLVEGFSLNPLGKVVGDCEHVDSLAKSHYEFFNDVYPLLHEWPWGDNGSELLGVGGREDVILAQNVGSCHTVRCRRQSQTSC